MKSSTFAAFVAPSLVMMLVFIAAPLFDVFGESFFLTTPVTEQITAEPCTPGFVVQNCTQETKSQPKRDDAGWIVTQTPFVGLQSYAAILEPARAWAAVATFDYRALMAIDVWRALRFTLVFTFITLPLVLLVGLGVARAVNNTAKFLRGPVIFVSLLRFIITPVIGALAIRWLFVSDGLLNHGLERLLGHPVSMFSQGWTIEILMMFFCVWHVAPFAFIILYAGKQTLNHNAIDAAMIDGASRGLRLRYVVVPQLMPLIIFVALRHLPRGGLIEGPAPLHHLFMNIPGVQGPVPALGTAGKTTP